MQSKSLSRSVEFFETQFQRQSALQEYVLNPFETAVLPFLSGRVLDFGCGMGNLAVAAARSGYEVTALDASPAAITDLAKRAAASALRIDACVADLRDYKINKGRYDCVVSIGLLMFFPEPLAHAALQRIRSAVPPDGIAAVNVLIEGTTFMGMFDPPDYYLFQESELQDMFTGWIFEYLKLDTFPAPGDTIKRFCTIAARRPG
jgi:tellurite methyltransferase